MKIDLTWISDDLFTTFLVNSEAGRVAYNDIVKTCGSPKVLNIHRAETIAQLKSAGYGVRKSTTKPEPFNQSDLAILDRLGA